MKITDISISVFQLPTQTPYFNLSSEELNGREVWRNTAVGSRTDELHVLHVRTDQGITGTCTVGDARYTTMRQVDLEHLRHIAKDEDPLNRKRLNSKLNAASRHIFTIPSWYGAFDNCLWDIEGKVKQLPVYELIGAQQSTAPAYYNYRSSHGPQAALDDIQSAIELGFTAIKDHLSFDIETNIQWFNSVRQAVGDDIEIMHDAAGAKYALPDAIRAATALHELGYRWFEEPLPDRDFNKLRQLTEVVEVPILACETLMHEPEISSIWLELGACDILRANARNGTSSTLELAKRAATKNANVELNGPGGLFGLVHAHLSCAIPNTTYYEYFPGGTRDELGKEIGLMNPPIPENGSIQPPDLPGWGAQWDERYFGSKRIATL